MARPSYREPFARLRSAYVVDSAGCWVWQRRLNPGGYGEFSLRGVRMGAHRASYLMHKGAIPKRHDIDHLCRTRACVNPDHLEAVTRGENLRRGEGGQWNRETERCPQGHPYDDFNTYVDPRGWRGCRACRREASNRHKRKRAAS